MEHTAATRKQIRDSEIAKLREEFEEDAANAMIAKWMHKVPWFLRRKEAP